MAPSSCSCTALSWCACAESRLRIHRARPGRRHFRGSSPPRWSRNPPDPLRELWRLLLGDGVFSPLVLFTALALSALGTVFEAVLFRSLFDAGRELSLFDQRLTFISAFLVFAIGLLLLELPILDTLQRMGRRLEIRLRTAFQEKIPLLSDRYFQSRPTSDMAERSHSVHQLREVPEIGARLVRTLFELLVTTAGLIWIDIRSAPLAVLAAILAIVIPLLLQRPINEHDLRLRTHVGGLSHFYLDALLGLVTIRTHSAETAIRREQESLLVEWARAGRSLVRAVVTAEGLQSLFGFGLVVWLLIDFLGRSTDASQILLFLYWGLNLPVLGQELAFLARQYPALRNVVLRLLEPLMALEEAVEPQDGPRTSTEGSSKSRGVSISMHGVAVRAAGHTILEDIDVAIAPGEHVAIVGPSGAGKSSLLGLLLGWNRPALGQVRIDEEPLDAMQLRKLRAATAWVEPAVQLWNRTVLENLLYGSDNGPVTSLSRVLEDAHLGRVLESLPDGMQSLLGEGGALVSGGEGQRVRFARAMLKQGTRLVLLDEPFRGLDREQRRALLKRARSHWHDATLLCVTHDVGDILELDRVLVMDAGRIVEDGIPAQLLEKKSSLFRALHDAERELASTLWSSATWGHLWLEDGLLAERRGGQAP